MKNRQPVTVIKKVQARFPLPEKEAKEKVEKVSTMVWSEEPKGLEALRKLGVMVVSLRHLQLADDKPAWGVRMPYDTIYVETEAEVSALLKEAKICACPSCATSGPHKHNGRKGWERMFTCRKCDVEFEF